MFEFSFELSDRIQKIQQINKDFNLEKNAYVSFSGGKDSAVLSKIIDLALPNNSIPRVFINTGIEFNEVVAFVREQQKKDNRIIEVKSGVNIRQMLEENGYPFKSKEHAHKLHLLQQGSKAKSVISYFTIDPNKRTLHNCPKCLAYQKDGFDKFKVSDSCCTILKKQPAEKWSKENNRQIAIIGIRAAEGGQRKNVSSCLYYQRNRLKKFSPLLVCSDSFIDNFVEVYKVELCKLYYAPYNFKRTGCKGCPFNIKLQDELLTLAEFFPSEKKQCEYIFGKVYEEYKRINYRITKSILDLSNSPF